jgi:ABC-type Fe3+/spermidine/putrescine transport system ATPase subunit
VYRSPATLDVARFIGVPNLLPARRRGELVETEIGQFRANGVRGPDDTPLVALVQAEDLGLEPDPAGAGKIESSVFQGRSRSYRVTLPSGLTIRCSVPLGGASALQPGSRVRVVPTCAAVSCFPAQSPVEGSISQDAGHSLLPPP